MRVCPIVHQSLHMGDDGNSHGQVRLLTTIYIAQVTRHKNIESLKYYLEEPTSEDMTSFSNSLFDYASKKPSIDKEESKTDNNSDDDFKDPPCLTHNLYEDIKTKNKTDTNNTEIVTLQPDFTDDSNSNLDMDVPMTSTNNIMQMYRQNPIGMLVGANLNNCTININMPK